MASYQPPSEILPIFDNSVFTSTSSGGLTLAQANALYLRKTYPDICTALETFNAGIMTTFITSSGDIKGPIVSNSISSVLPSDTINIYNNSVNGILNFATNARTANINIGTGQTNNQFTLGSNTNTQTNIYGGAVLLGNNTTVTGTLDSSGQLSGGSIYTTGTLNSGAITCTSANTSNGNLTLGTGNISSVKDITASGNITGTFTGTVSSGAITCTSLNTTNGSITLGTGGLSSSGALSSGAISCSSLNAQSGLIKTTGNLTVAGVTCSSLSLSSGSAGINSTGNIRCTSVDTSDTNGDITLGSGSLSSSGALSSGAITCTSVNTTNGNITMGTGALSSGGITCTSVNTTNGNLTLGTGNISSVKDITASGNISGTFTGTVSGGAITCTSLNTTNGNITMGTGSLSNSGTLSCGALTCTSATTSNGNLTLGTGNISSVKDITASGNITGTFTGTVSGGAITCTSLNTTNGNITMGSGSLSSSGALSSGGITCTSVNTTNGSITLGTGGLSSSGALSSGAITCTSVNTTNGSITLGTGGLSSSGALSSGAITCTSVNTTNGNLTLGSGGLSSSGALSSGGITCTSVNTTNGNLTLGTGNISSVNDITASGNITGTFTGTVSSGAITCTSLNTTNGNITMGSGGLSSSGDLSCGDLTCTSVNTTNGNITMGTGGLSSSGDLSCGDLTCTSATTSNGNLTVGTGNITVDGNIISGGAIKTSTIQASTATSALAIGNNQTSGGINIGTFTNRTGPINIGTGAVSTSASPITIGNGNVDTIIDGNLTVNGTFGLATVESNLIKSVLSTDTTAIYDNQTSGTLTLGNSPTRTGPIRIGTANVTTSGGGVYIGSNFNPVTINGTLSVLGPFSLATVQSNLINAVLATDTTSIYDNQTTGALTIGNSSTRTAPINIGTANVTTAGGGVFIGSSLNPVTINGNLSVLGGFSFGSSAFNTITSTLATDTANLYNNQTSGILNIGTSATRTGSINIGNGATSVSGGIFIGNNNNLTTMSNTTISDLTVSGIINTTNIQASPPTTGTIVIGDQQTSGILYIGTTPSGRTGNIIVGASTCNASFRSPIVSQAGITVPTSNIIVTAGNIQTNTINSTSPTSDAYIMNNQTSGNVYIGTTAGRTGSINIGVITSTTYITGTVELYNNLNLAISSIILTSGNVVITNGYLHTNNIRSITPTSDFNFMNTQTSGILYIANGASRTGNVVIANQALNGSIILGNANVDTQILGGITLGVPPTLTTTSLGYYYNFPLFTYTGITTTGYRYSPLSNVVGGPNQFEPGVYEAVINVVYRYTSNPTAFNLNYNFGIASGVALGVVTTATVTDITPISRTNTGTLITGANNNDFCSSHVLGFTSTGGFFNLFFNVSALTITSGTMVINMYGTVKRIA